MCLVKITFGFDLTVSLNCCSDYGKTSYVTFGGTITKAEENGRQDVVSIVR